MDDSISRRATLKALLDKGQHSRRYKLGDVWELNFDEIREVINALPPAAGPQWTPCSKGLPKKDGDYFVTFNNGMTARLLYIKGLSDEFWMSWVAAWMPMPMPKPYRQNDADLIGDDNG